MFCHKKIIALLLTVASYFFYSSHAQIRLPALVKDSMVLQRQSPIHIWGWAGAGEKITVRFNGKKSTTTTAANGRWGLVLPSMEAGGPYTMDITGKNKISLKDILVGDVWFCSGQSNMVHQMALHNITYAGDIVSADYPQIRHFWVPLATRLTGPGDNLLSGFWKTANPEDVKQFSAVAYFFARKLYERYHVPIGLINASVGGTPIEAWTSEEGLNQFPELMNTLLKNKDTTYINNINRQAFAIRAGQQQQRQTEKDFTGDIPWYDVAYVPKGWHNFAIPGYWADQGAKDLHGVVWFRKEIDLPAVAQDAAVKVFLGRIIDADVLYINGKQAGSTGYQYPQRRYTVPAVLLKPGKNLFVIKVTNTGGKGGFVPGKPYYITIGKDTIDLKGYWQYKAGNVYHESTAAPGPESFSAQNQPAALYNAMVAPLVPFVIKGVLWYQGESNAGNPSAYNQLLPALIADWRSKWSRQNLPFLFVQLPNYMEVNYHPANSNWALLREAQLHALSVPNTGMAVAIDLGEWNDIHPDNKKDVGERLALVAEKLVYGENITATGPLYTSDTIEGNKIIVSFTSTGTGLTTIDGEALMYFAIAGADKNFIWANAAIQGDKVVVWHDSIPNPKYVRYAWADNPDGANLYNKEGLPASPFRTDGTK